jgi:hypothetical protein
MLYIPYTDKIDVGYLHWSATVWSDCVNQLIQELC